VIILKNKLKEKHYASYRDHSISSAIY